MRHSTKIEDPELFMAIQHLDPEANEDPVYLAARGFRAVSKRVPWLTPQRCADIAILVWGCASFHHHNLECAMSEDHIRYQRETSLWWIDTEIESVKRMTVQIGEQCRPIPVRFRQPLIRVFQQLREAVERGDIPR